MLHASLYLSRRHLGYPAAVAGRQIPQGGQISTSLDISAEPHLAVRRPLRIRRQAEVPTDAERAAA